MAGDVVAPAQLADCLPLETPARRPRQPPARVTAITQRVRAACGMEPPFGSKDVSRSRRDPNEESPAFAGLSSFSFLDCGDYCETVIAYAPCWMTQFSGWSPPMKRPVPTSMPT